MRSRDSHFRRIRLSSALLTMLLCAGCGLKGALYSPDTAKQPVPAGATDSETEQKQQRKDRRTDPQSSPTGTPTDPDRPATPPAQAPPPER